MANLLQKASIVLTPTAYDNSKVLCVKPSDGSGDFDFSRNSAATRVNAQGLVENVQILSSNLVQNGSFSEQGAEQITNGDFATDSDWGKVNATISGGTGNLDSTSGTSLLFQSALVIGKTYKATLEVSNYNGLGTCALIISTGAIQQEFTSNGVKEFYFTHGGSNTNLTFRATSGGVFSITNISVKEVGQNWALGTDWGIGENKAIRTGTASSGLTQSYNFSNAKKYRLKFTISDFVSGAIKGEFIGGGGSDLFFTNNNIGNGTFTFETTTTTNRTGLQFYVFSSFQGSITNISVIEITDDTNLPRINYEGFSYQDALGSENIDLTAGNTLDASAWGSVTTSGVSYLAGTGSLSYYNTGFIVTAGLTYKLSFTISDYTGSNDLGFSTAGGVSTSARLLANGTYTEYFTATSNTGLRLFGRATNTGVFSNVSVKEYSGQEVVPNSGCGSLLFEPQSTNLITYSETLGNNTTSGSISFTYNNSISPDGTQNAALVSVTNANDRLQPSFAAVNSLVAISIFLKHNGTDFSTRINTFNTGTGTLFGANANVTASNVTFTSYQGGFDSASFVDYGNGWFRVIVVCQSTTGTTFAQWRPTTASVALSYPCFGFQVEQQSFATSYIPTSGSTVTRNQDLCTNGGSLATINSTEGTLYAEITALANDLSFRSIGLSDGTANNRILILYTDVSNGIRVLIFRNNLLQVILNHTINITDVNKVAVRYKFNDVSFWVNGTKLSTDTNAFMPIGLNQLSFSRGDGDLPFFGKTKALAVFPYLTDAELTALTTI